MKEELCKAFCNELLVREVPAGLAVSTGFDGMNGDPIGFYVLGPDANGRYRLEDDGTTMPLIEAQGADLDSQTRAEAFQALLDEYGATYDEDRAELRTPSLALEDVSHAAMRFVALLLRLQDMVLMTYEKVASTFKEDAVRAIRAAFDEKVEIRENEAIGPNIEIPADLILKAEGRDQVAVFLAPSEQRVLEAVVAQMAAIYEAHIPCSVIALLERDTSVTRKTRAHAANRLTAMTYFENDQNAAMLRIRREVLGPQSTLH